MTITREEITSIIRVGRIAESIRDKGIEVTCRRNLDRMTNVQTCWGGHLKDATCHYSQRLEYSGNTYNVRHVLKARGFRWDAGRKAWWLKYSGEVDISGISAELLRALAA